MVWHNLNAISAQSCDFVFSSCKTARPLAEREFKKAFLKYCGEEFYPHIVRSHFATSRVKNFLKGKRKASKEEVENLFMSIAHELGHRKFSKKENKWVDSHSVTVNHYIQPELVDRVRGIIVGKKKWFDYFILSSGVGIDSISWPYTSWNNLDTTS